MERFWIKVRNRESNFACWEWTAGLTAYGGAFWMKGKNVPAHRVAYTLLKGEIPEGYVIMRCRNDPRCVNPAHMECKPRLTGCAEAGTRSLKGLRSLSYEDTEAIRAEYAEGDTTYAKLGEKYGVTLRTVHRICAGQSWNYGPKGKRKRVLPKGKKKGALALVARGELTYEEIAERYGLSVDDLVELVEENKCQET